MILDVSVIEENDTRRVLGNQSWNSLLPDVGISFSLCTPALSSFIPVLASVDIRQKRQYYFTPENL
ncbi:MAG: hypothetical protein NTZ35_18780 [Ignavibacteriales bacterium]|nr:hypothetical protein [Ignavibacteriales bacterium]